MILFPLMGCSLRPHGRAVVSHVIRADNESTQIHAEIIHILTQTLGLAGGNKCSVAMNDPMKGQIINLQPLSVFTCVGSILLSKAECE